MQSLGNHEFDNGISGLTPFIENLTSPVLCANLILTKVPELATEENLKKSIIINVNGNKVGIVGYLTPETKVVAKPNNVEYIEEVEALKVEVKQLQEQGIKIIIALGHSGYMKDQEIGREVDGVDLVIGGHTNTFLFNGTTPDVEYAQGPYPTYVTQPTTGRRVPVVQAYAYTKYLGKLVLTFDSDGEVIDADGQPILLDNSVPQDPDVLKLLKKFREDTLASLDDIIGSTSLVLSATNCALDECNLGNLITDAMVFRYASDYKPLKNHWTDAPIAILQAGAIRTSIAHESIPTDITKGDLLSVMPFEGNLTAVSMNGTVLLQALEISAADHNSDFGARFLQFSGLRVIYNMKKPKGSRVVKAQARCWTCSVPSFINVHKNSIYKVLMPSFLSNGGDGYSMFQGLEFEPLGYSELTSTEYYSLGNHEFDETVAGVVPFIRNLSSPVLAANLILDKVPELEQATNLRKSVTLELNGVKIGVIGYLTAETKFLAPKNNVEYEDEVIAIRKEVEKLKKEGVNIFIALGHSGFMKDLEIARDVDDIDLVIGGHSNTFLWNSPSTNEVPEVVEGPYPVEVRQSSGRIVRVVQAYAYTKYLGSLNIIFDSKGEIIQCDGTPILLDQEMPRDPELLKMVEKYRSEIDRYNNVVVGTSAVVLHGEYCRLRECNIGDLITDSMLNYTKESFGGRYSDVNIGVIQGGRIRTSIDRPHKPFEMTRGDWVTVLPFSDTLAIVTMNGSVLLKGLEHAVEGWRTVDSPGQFLQISGMRVTYDLAKPPGSRVASAEAVCSSCQHDKLTAVRNKEEYKVLMCVFLADGGDGYSIFEDLPRELLPFSEVDTVIHYLNRSGIVSHIEDGRIRLLNNDKVKNPQAGFIITQANSSNRMLISYNFALYCIFVVLSSFVL